MEESFGSPFDDVRVHEGPQAEALGAQAYAEGSDLHFAPGKYDPHSAGGQELLGHELAHVVQQRAGRVETPQGKDGINADPALEAEADAAGARAAQGLPAEVQGAASGRAVQLRPMTQEEIEGAAEMAEYMMRDVAEGVTLTYKGKGWSPGAFPVGVADDLMMADLLDKLSGLRSIEPRLAVAAVRSVANDNEMLGVEPMFDDNSGTHVELPASYQQDPPTDEITLFIAVHEAISFVESLIVAKARDLYRDSEGIYDDGMIETRSEHSDRKWAEVAAATLDGLTGTFGGVIGFAVSNCLTDDPEVIAAATQFGENVTSTVGIVVGVDPITGGKKGGKQPTPKKSRKSGKSKKKGKAGKAPSGGTSKRRKKPVNLPSWRDMKINTEHIVSGHTAGGKRGAANKDQFPDGWTTAQIEKAIMEAYRHGKRVRSQGDDRIQVQGEGNGIVIEMWVNVTTKEIETAYPVSGP